MPFTNQRPDLTKLGRFIRERRMALGLTQSELGERVGWAQEKISALEHGKYGTPALPGLSLLAEGLEVPLSVLLEAAGFLRDQGPMAGSFEAPSFESRARVSHGATPDTRTMDVRTLRRESNRLAIRLEDLQSNLRVAQERIELVDQLRSRLATTRKELELLSVTLHRSH